MIFNDNYLRDLIILILIVFFLMGFVFFKLKGCKLEKSTIPLKRDYPEDFIIFVSDNYKRNFNAWTFKDFPYNVSNSKTTEDLFRIWNKIQEVDKENLNQYNRDMKAKKESK